MNVAINKVSNKLNWSKIIKNNFDLKNGQGYSQLDLNNFFSKKDCEEIYSKFNSNLNWIIRDSQKLNIPNKQIPIAKNLIKLMSFFCNLLQENIPEKKHVHLKLETLRVARSDGSQHQVGSKWHQDHEAYFTLLINLNENYNPNYSTKFFNLKPKERYNFDNLGNPIVGEKWKQNFIKPFHLGILNSGIRFFLFPYDKCRPIVHHAPNSDKKRLAIFATLSISGVDQGMDLKDIYLPLIKGKLKKKKVKNLKNLRNHWRDILGIKDSLRNNSKYRISQSENGLYKLKSTKFNILKKNYRIVNFGLKEFEKDFRKNKKIIRKAIIIGENARTINYFSKIGNFSIKKLLDKKHLNLKISDCSVISNNNYDLFVQFRLPNKAFQFLKMKQIFNHIDSFVLILYPNAQNYIYNKKINYYKNSLPYKRFNNKNINSSKKAAQVITSFDINDSISSEKSFLFLNSIKLIWKRGIKEAVINKKKEYFLINKNNYRKKTRVNFNNNLNKKMDKVPFFLPRVGIDRKLPLINSDSEIFRLSRNIIKK